MRGEGNGLKALILNECPFTYYVHCFAHQLQLALVAASKDVSEVHTFFKHLNFIVNIIGSSTKRNDQLQDAQLADIAHLAEIGELEGGRGAN
ncbi:zinc finger MYM-type protein 1-like protein [Tanacetum coccineum]